MDAIKELAQTLGPMGTFAAVVLYMMFHFLKGKKNNGEDERIKKLETQIKEESRVKIDNTNSQVNAMAKQIDSSVGDFYHMKTATDEIHEIVTEKGDGVPLVYGAGLKEAIKDLALAVKELKA